MRSVVGEDTDHGQKKLTPTIEKFSRMRSVVGEDTDHGQKKLTPTTDKKKRHRPRIEKGTPATDRMDGNFSSF